MDFQQFLGALGAAARLDVGAAAQAGGCTIQFDRELEVTFEHQADERLVQVFAPVLTLGSMAGAQRERLFAALLQLHLFGLATGGAAFGFDAQQDRVLLFRTVHLEGLAPEQAVQAIESFVNQLERWRANLMDLVARPAAAGQDLSATPMQRV